MDYLFGPSRATAKAAHNPWAKISKADLNKYLTKQDKQQCKRVAECLMAMAPLLEEAAHQVVVEEWWKDLWLQARIALVSLFILLLLGGISLVTAVIYAGSVPEAIKAVYTRLKTIKLFKKFFN
jgi:maltodextrin utilization protein YvdJ